MSLVKLRVLILEAVQRAERRRLLMTLTMCCCIS